MDQSGNMTNCDKYTTVADDGYLKGIYPKWMTNYIRLEACQERRA